MTTLRQIVIDAFRESGITAVGDVPDGDEFTEGLRRLNNIIETTFGAELGEQLTTYDFGTVGVTKSYKTKDVASITPTISNVRLVFNLSGASTLHLPPTPNDGARFAVIDNEGNFSTANLTIDGNGRKIESASSLVANTNGFSREWFYRDDLANWVKVTDLLADDSNPFPAEFDDYLIIKLAMRINPRFGADTKPETLDAYKDLRRKFRARYRQEMEKDSELGLLRLSQNRGYYRLVSDFNSGSL